MNQQIVAIIPARGGSKGIPRKNIRLLGGKPLIAWSIEAAKQSGVVDRVIVSTEDEEIAEIAKEWGADVPFMRPVEMARDDSLIGEAVSWTLHRLHWECGLSIKGRMVLLPSHPFRSIGMFRAAAQAIDQGLQSFTTMRVFQGEESRRFVEMEPDGTLCPLLRDRSGLCRPVMNRPYGLLSAAPSEIRDGKNAFYPLRHPVHLIDIDTAQDFRAAEHILELGLYDFHAD